MIINALPELETLQSLVLASPSYHAIYANSREALLTEFTFRQLESRNFNLFQPMDGLYIYRRITNAGPVEAVIDAVDACAKWSRRPKLFKLSVGFCIELLRLEGAFPLPDEEGCHQRVKERTRGAVLEVLKISLVVVDSQSEGI